MKTPEQLRQLAAAIEAHERGEKVEWRMTEDHDWKHVNDSSPHQWCDSWLFRPAPQPVTRPWSKPEDVPGPVCWMKKGDAWQRLVIMVNTGRITMIDGLSTSLKSLTYEEIANWQYSTDRKTWHKCEVTK